MSTVPFRKVRSFVRRPGRITAAQQKALQDLLPRYGIAYELRRLDLAAVFGRDAPRVLDIGFGDGEALVSMAANKPDADFLGVEVHEPGIGRLLLMLEHSGMSNVRIIARDVMDVLNDMLADACLDVVNLFFPDPWPKKRHHKRRLVQRVFVEQLARVLKDDGLFHLATDWSEYAEHTEMTLAESADFRRIEPADLCHNPLAERTATKFERRGRQRGHDIVDLYYGRIARNPPASSIDAPAGS